jgi:ribosomal protein S18 acetylase RimI-like enzyme
MTTNEVTIRMAQERDWRILAQFNADMALETEGKRLAPEVVAAGVRALLADRQRGFYVIAELHQQLAGALMVTTEWSDWRNGEFWWIQSVYVQSRFRRRGIYRRLYEFVKAKAMQQGNVCGFRLYVERDNHVAQATYRRLGMEETVYRMFEEMNR